MSGADTWETRAKHALALHTPVRSPAGRNQARPLCTECGNPVPCATELALLGSLRTGLVRRDRSGPAVDEAALREQLTRALTGTRLGNRALAASAAYALAQVAVVSLRPLLAEFAARMRKPAGS